MQKKTYTVDFGSSVTAFPKEAAKKIAKGEASLTEIRVLTAFLMGNGSSVSTAKLCTQTALDEGDVISALAYWRGVGVLSYGDDERTADEVSAPTPEKAKTEEKLKKTEAEAPKKKALLSAEMPKYTGIEISAMLDKDGGKLREMIDECQQLMGRIFTPTDTTTVVGLCDWLGLEADFVITLVAYYASKKPGCNVRYIEKAAVELVNNEIITLEALDAHIRDLELYDGIAGKLRSLIGIGGRAFTKKENATITHWAKELGYGIDIITMAYECCCDSKGAFNFDYANRILENWYSAGVKTPDDAKKELERFRTQNSQKDKGSDLAKSFDADEFFSAALKRTYKNLAKK